MKPYLPTPRPPVRFTQTRLALTRALTILQEKQSRVQICTTAPKNGCTFYLSCLRASFSLVSYSCAFFLQPSASPIAASTSLERALDALSSSSCSPLICLSRT
jgi:hypothetical protein